MAAISGESFALFCLDGSPVACDVAKMAGMHDGETPLSIYDSRSGGFVKVLSLKKADCPAPWTRADFGADGSVDLMGAFKESADWKSVPSTTMDQFLFRGGCPPGKGAEEVDGRLWRDGCIAASMRGIERRLLVLEMGKGCPRAAIETLKKYFMAPGPGEKDGRLVMHVIAPLGSMSRENPEVARIPEGVFSGSMRSRLSFAAGIADVSSPSARVEEGNMFIPAKFPNRCMAHQASVLLKSVLSPAKILGDGLTVEFGMNPYLALCLENRDLVKEYFALNPDLNVSFPERKKADFKGLEPLDMPEGAEAYEIDAAGGSFDVNGVCLRWEM